MDLMMMPWLLSQQTVEQETSTIKIRFLCDDNGGGDGDDDEYDDDDDDIWNHLNAIQSVALVQCARNSSKS